MSYLEIYNENIRDLLNPGSGFLELREDTSKNRTIQVTGLSEAVVVSIDEVMGLLQQGNRQRTVEPTGVNKTSSRSHALLSVTVSKASRTATAVRQGRLFMIDLAGSERASHTKVRLMDRSYDRSYGYSVIEGMQKKKTVNCQTKKLNGPIKKYK